MALTNSFPTGLPAGLSVADTRRIIASLIVRDTTGAPRLGIFPRHFLPLVTATSSMAYAIGAFEAAVSRTGVGVELVVNDGTTNVPTTASPAANSRIDVIWVRSRFNASGDTSDAPEFGVTSGAAASTPTKPAIPLGALELAVATVPSSAIATNSAGVVITQTHLYTAGSGGQVAIRTTTDLSAFAAQSGQRAYAVSAGATYLAVDSGWLVESDSKTTSLQRFVDINSVDIPATTTPKLVRSTPIVSQFSRRALISVNYQWLAESIAAGNHSLRLGPTTDGTSLTGDLRVHNHRVVASRPMTLTATAVLPAGTTVLSLWASADSTGAPVAINNVVMNVYPL